MAKRKHRPVNQVDGSVSSNKSGDNSALVSSPRKINFGLIVLLFTASGFSSLIYQVVWTRMLSLVFGSTTYATATVLAVFMGGLALGSFVAGRYADKLKRCFYAYGVLEGVIGVWAICIPFMFGLAIPLYKWMWQLFHLNLLSFSLLRLAVAALILLLPTTCMGATLPLLSKFVTDKLDYVGSRVGTLYAVNTFGAVLGSALAGFVLLPTLGLFLTIVFSAVINVLLCVVVLATSPALEEEGQAIDPFLEEKAQGNKNISKNDKLPLPWSIKTVLLSFAASGAIAMIYEVAWTRSLLMVIGSSTYAFTIMLTTFLMGIFFGSYICARFIDKVKQPIIWFVVLQFALCILGLAAMYSFNYVPWWNISINNMWRENIELALLTRFILASIILLPLALCLGGIFPVVVKICTRDLNLLGRSIGNIYSVNTVGAILGSMLSGFVLIPLFGVEKTLIIASMGSFLLGVINVQFIEFLAPALKFCIVLFSLPLIPIAIANSEIWDKLLVVTAQSERRLLVPEPLKYRNYEDWRKHFNGLVKLLYYKDGASSNVGILDYNTKHTKIALATNGHMDASDGLDMATQIMLAAFPLAFKPGAQDVAVIGWGSGVTLGVSSLFPVKEITAIELEPAVIEGSKHFHHVNHSPETNPKVKVELNDGRNYLLATDKKFDVIISEPSNPWQAGVCNLFTKEFFGAAKNSLRPGGIFALWLQTIEIPPKNVKEVLAALHEQFPYCAAMVADTGDLVVLASDKPITADLNEMQKIFKNEQLVKDLGRLNITNAESIVARVCLTPKNIDALVKNVKPNCDDTNKLEYDIGKHYETHRYLEENMAMFFNNSKNLWDIVDLANLSKKDLGLKLGKIADEAMICGHPANPELWAIQSINLYPNVDACRTLGTVAWRNDQKEKAMQLWNRAKNLDPNDLTTRAVVAVAYREQGNRELCRQEYLEMAKIDPKERRTGYEIAKTYLPQPFECVPPEQGVAIYNQAVMKDSAQKILKYLGDLPEDPEFVKSHHDVLFIAGYAHYILGQDRQAEQYLREFVALEPTMMVAPRVLANVLYRSGQTREAAALWCATLMDGQAVLSENLNKAEFLLARGSHSEALKILAEQAELYPGSRELFSLVESLSSKGNKRATQLLEQLSILRVERIGN